MYVSLLSGALDLWDTDLDDEALLDYVRHCRAALPAQDLGRRRLVERLLWPPRSPMTGRSSVWPPNEAST